MLKLIPIFLIILVSLSCSERPDLPKTRQEIINFQTKIKVVDIDSIPILLQKAERLLADNTEISDSLRAENHYLLGLYFQKKGNLDQAAIAFQRATDYVKDSIWNYRQMNYFYQTHFAYLVNERYGDCLATADQLESLVQPNDFDRLAWVYFFRESTYLDIPDYQKALENNKLNVDNLIKAQDSTRLIQALIFQERLKFHHLNDKDGAFAILDTLLASEKSLTNNYKRQIYSDYGVYLFKIENFDQSKKYYQKVLQIIREDSKSPLLNSYFATEYANLAEVCLKLGQFNETRAYLDSVKAIGLNNIDTRLQKSILQYELQLAYAQKTPISTLTELVDSIHKNQMDQYTVKFENELVALKNSNQNERLLTAQKQASELKNLKLQTRLILLVSIFVLLITIGYFIYRKRRLDFQKQNLQMQQRLLRSQMNPHFTFNTLAAIQSKIKSDQEGATKYLLKFSRLLRLILENSMKNYVLLDKELESLKKYIDLQLLRFPDTFSYEILLKDIEEEDFIFIPPMLIQPFVENSIQHGFAGISYPGKITITLTKAKSFIQCIIEDNGRGLNATNPHEKQSASIALIANYLEKATKSKIQIINKVEQNTSNHGVIISFLIPSKTTEND